MNTAVRNRLESYSNIVLLGEAGAGKSEVSLQMAEDLAAAYPERTVELFDLDQTKPLFRSREAREAGFRIHAQRQIMDSPTAAAGVSAAIEDPDRLTLLDVGGGEQGARMIGQYRESLELSESVVLFLINPYRIWSGSGGDVEGTLREVMGPVSGLDRIIAANPNFGPETTTEDVTEGVRILRERLGMEPELVCVPEWTASEVSEMLSLPVLSIRLRLCTSRVEDMANQCTGGNRWER